MHELRHYTLFPDSLNSMLERWEAVNLPLFNDHGIAVDHVWTDADDETQFYFLLSFDNRDARDQAWAEYHEDPRFLEAKESQSKIIQGIELTMLDQARKD